MAADESKLVDFDSVKQQTLQALALANDCVRKSHNATLLLLIDSA